MSLFLRRWAYKLIRTKTVVRQRQDHDVKGRELRCRTGSGKAVHMQSGQEGRERLHSLVRRYRRFRDRKSNF